MATGPRYSIFQSDALDDTRIGDRHLRVLAVAGTYADNNGWFIVSQSTFAKRVRCARETVNRILRDLVEFGYLRKRGRAGDDGRRLVSQYQVLMDREPVNLARDDAPHVTPRSQGVCDATVTPPVTQLDHTPCDAATSQQGNDPFIERPFSPNGEARALDLVPDGNKDAAFEAWWSRYPEKVGKGAARKAFDQAQRKTSLDVLVAGVERYKASKPADRAWCHPTTWLNQERWLDQPAATAPRTLGDWSLDRLRDMGGENVVDHQH
ncbi:helix-turn-helix domain-containing protein [Mesorhizobium huakuii]|uniref:Helix-turn-helix domain-containing protein n=1 Tax=Mesorhizobium huakuii TaxID=28104 RepID=A0A7G6SUP5_9HYPH|nr:helix-turn-helix domain-containing protein [Mesorhizobium huakuii]QND58227.1 helix-turn-helix domain-containing protein [Mesorhizobium huakuii]